jgi:hypothetical protein
MWGVVKTRAVLIGLLFLTQGCGAKWHLKRAVAKDPTIVEQVAVKLDTIVVTEIKAVHDTLVLSQYDTIEVERNGVRVQLMRIHDTIQVTAECLPDTIQVTQVVKVPQVVYKENEFKLIDKVLILSIILATFALIRLFIRK